jgi:hypothetical protein
VTVAEHPETSYEGGFDGCFADLAGVGSGFEASEPYPSGLGNGGNRDSLTSLHPLPGFDYRGTEKATDESEADDSGCEGQ